MLNKIDRSKKVRKLNKIQPNEYRAIAALSGIFSLRMFGLFMILPVFAFYAVQLTDSTPILIGIALGVYGLTQALLHIPFGYLSDRFGRKPMVIIGLIIFCLGSMVAAMSDSIQGMIVGRSLQGAGAVGSVVMALLADLTRDEIRLRAMASIGITIALSFGLSFLLGPLLCAQWGLSGIFWITAGLGLLGIVVLLRFVPTPEVKTNKLEERIVPIIHSDYPESITSLYFGVLVLHASLTALFLKIPNIVHALTTIENQYWNFYLPVFGLALVATVPLLLIIEKTKQFKKSLFVMVISLIISEILLFIFQSSLVGLGLGLGLFFTTFNCLEATLPSTLSKMAPVDRRGKVLGIFSTLQFLGLFLGGALGGFLDNWDGEVTVFAFCIILALTWLVWILFNKRGNKHGTRN